jgi:hypothetical protein
MSKLWWDNQVARAQSEASSPSSDILTGATTLDPEIGEFPLCNFAGSKLSEVPAYVSTVEDEVTASEQEPEIDVIANEDDDGDGTNRMTVNTPPSFSPTGPLTLKQNQPIAQDDASVQRIEGPYTDEELADWASASDIPLMAHFDLGIEFDFTDPTDAPLKSVADALKLDLHLDPSDGWADEVLYEMLGVTRAPQLPQSKFDDI